MNAFEDFFEAKRFDFDLESDRFIQHMDYLRGMTVQELTLYKKWIEAQSYLGMIDKSQVTKAKIWKPSDIMNKELTINEIETLRPNIRFVSPDKTRDVVDWQMLRIFCHTMSFDQNPGRFLRYIVYDEITNKLLGIGSLGSDVISIACRDAWIGWKHQEKLKSGRLNNTAIGTCIMGTQPFGYNFLGGKLIASLLLAKAVRDSWESLYDNKLVGITTTSLYGTNSMYNGIPFWKKLGASAGKIAIKPDDSYYDIWHQYLKETYPEVYQDSITPKDGRDGPVTGVKQKILTLIFRELKMKASKYAHGFERGVYYAPIYSNTREYLRGEINDDKLVLLDRLTNDVDSIVSWWKPKAINRYTNLYNENRLKPEILYYNQLIGLDWEETKKRFLGDVGR